METNRSSKKDREQQMDKRTHRMAAEDRKEKQRRTEDVGAMVSPPT